MARGDVVLDIKAGLAAAWRPSHTSTALLSPLGSAPLPDTMATGLYGFAERYRCGSPNREEEEGTQETEETAKESREGKEKKGASQHPPLVLSHTTSLPGPSLLPMLGSPWSFQFGPRPPNRERHWHASGLSASPLTSLEEVAVIND